MGRISGQRPWRRDRVVVTGTAPSAGSDWSFTVPAGHLYLPLTLYAFLSTAVAAATRRVDLIIGDGDATFIRYPSPTGQAANSDYGYSWTLHGAQWGSGDYQAMSLPDLALQPGWTIGVTTESIQAADQWQAPKLCVLDTTWQRGRVALDQVPELVVGIVGTPAG